MGVPLPCPRGGGEPIPRLRHLRYSRYSRASRLGHHPSPGRGGSRTARPPLVLAYSLPSRRRGRGPIPSPVVPTSPCLKSPPPATLPPMRSMEQIHKEMEDFLDSIGIPKEPPKGSFYDLSSDEEEESASAAPNPATRTSTASTLNTLRPIRRSSLKTPMTSKTSARKSPFSASGSTHSLTTRTLPPTSSSAPSILSQGSCPSRGDTSMDENSIRFHHSKKKNESLPHNKSSR